MAVGTVLPALGAHALALVQRLHIGGGTALHAVLQAAAKGEERGVHLLLAQVVSEPVGIAADRGRAAVEGQQEQPVVEFIAIALMVAETRDFAADLREQRGFAQQLVQVTLVEIVARAGPAYIERIFADLELASLLAQVVHVFHQVAERRVFLATLLGEGVALQQALPELATQIVDGRQVDDLQARRCLSAASSWASLAIRLWANIRISAREATSNSAGLLSFSGQMPRSRLATSTGAA